MKTKPEQLPAEVLKQMNRENWASLESQKQYWIDKEAESDNATTETRGVCPEDNASATSQPLTLDRTEATTEWFDVLADSPWSLRDDGRSDGQGMSYGERNV